MQTPTAQNISSSSAQTFQPSASEDTGYAMDQQALAYLNYGLLQTLCQLGNRTDDRLTGNLPFFKACGSQRVSHQFA